MARRCVLPIVIILLLAGLLSPGAQAATLASGPPRPPAPQVRVVASGPEAVVVELATPDYTLQQMEAAGEVFHRLLMPGLEQTLTPGTPQTPWLGSLVGVGSPVSVTLQVLEAETEILSGYRLPPAPHYTANGGLDAFTPATLSESFILDPAYGSQDAFLPPAPVALGQVGYLRHQAVAQLQFFPAQYNPAGRQLRIYHRLVVRVAWAGNAQASPSDGRGASAPYDAMLQTSLLNDPASLRPPDRGPSSLAALPSTRQPPGGSNPPFLKIGVDTDGLYVVTAAQLRAGGLEPATIDPRTLKLHHRGSELAVYVTGEEDGVFNEGDALLFYGEGFNDHYTNRNIYWLSAGGDPGRRMQVRSVAPAGGPVLAAHFPRLHHAEQDTVYWQTMPGRGVERWFWGQRLSPNTEGMPSSRLYPVVLHHPAANTGATLRVHLKGYTSLAHRTRLYLNNQLVDEQSWHGQVAFTHAVAVPSSLLRQGENRVRVEAADAGAVVDQILVDWIEFDYQMTYTAVENQLRFLAPTPGLQQFVLDGFTGADVGLFDITDAANPVRLVNPAITPVAGRYRVQFEDNAQPATRFLAAAGSAHRVPAQVVLDEPSTWKSPENGADYILITHEDFFAAIQPLADHRRSAGLRVATVKVGDIYDEFNAGLFNPRAIRDFVHYAYHHWAAPSPLYVLLVGDANQDYKDNLHNGTRNDVPSQTIDSDLFGEVSSDNWFVTVSGDDLLPDLFIGRLPAQSAQEAAEMVNKVIAYEQAPPDSSWNSQVLLVADDNEEKFRIFSDQLAQRLPPAYTVHRIDAANYPPGRPAQDIANQLAQGRVLVNYFGHGEYFGWGAWNNESEPIFDVEDVAALQNSNRLPVILVGNCLNGFFAGPKASAALAEVLLRRQQGGAVAVWAPSSLGYPTGHSVLLRAFFDALFVEDQLALGAAATVAKIRSLAQTPLGAELVQTYILFGDPAMRLGVPPNAPYILQTHPPDGASEVALDQPVVIHFSEPMNPAAVTLSAASLTGGASVAPFTPTWNADFTAARFTHPPFAHHQVYQLLVEGQDRQGNWLALGRAANPWSFTITTDETPPGGWIEAPGGDPTAVLTTAPLIIHFSEPVRPGSVRFSLTPAASGSLLWSPDGRQAMFVHERFATGASYAFSVDSALDLAGNVMPSPLVLTFTAGVTLDTYFPVIGRCDPESAASSGCG